MSDSDKILPIDVTCPHCGEELELEEEERKEKKFTCPACNSLIDLKDKSKPNKESDTIEHKTNDIGTFARISIFVVLFIGAVWTLIFSMIFSDYFLSRSKMQVGMFLNEQGQVVSALFDPRDIIYGNRTALKLIEQTAGNNPYYKDNIIRQARKEVNIVRIKGYIFGVCSYVLFFIIFKIIRKVKIKGREEPDTAKD